MYIHICIYIHSIASRIRPGQTCASCLVYQLLLLRIYATSWVKMCSEGDVGDPWGGPGLAGGSIWARWEVPGRTLGSLGIPGASLGIPWVVLGGPWACLGCPWGCLEGPWRVPGRPWSSPGILQDCPGTSQGPSLDALVGAMGALKNIEKPLFLLHFQHCGALGDPLGDP